MQRKSTASGDCLCQDMSNVSENAMNEECFATYVLYIYVCMFKHLISIN